MVGSPSYRAEAWPQIPNDWVLGLASGLATDDQDHIWLVHRPRTVVEADRDRAAPAVLEFDASGTFVQGWGGPEYVASQEFEWPDTEHGIHVDYQGNVWITGSGNGDHQILKFTRDGRFLLQIGKRGASRGNTDTQNLNQAADVYVHPETNEAFVADGYGNRRIIVFDATTGAFKRMWGAYGNPPTDPTPDEPEFDPKHFNLVHGVRISRDGLVYVSDRGGMRLQVFTTDGEFLYEKPMGRYPDPDPEVMAARANDTSFGEPTTELIRATARAHQSVSKTAFSSDPEQRWLFVNERSNHQLVVLDRRTLEELTRFGQHGDELGEMYILHDMTADSEGNLYTVEVNNIGGTRKRTQKWVLTGVSPM
jgi:DNA-binding beta-propeller fold protein YncE